MNIHALEILGLAVALGCDAFAVGLAVGTRCHQPRQVFRLSFHFGFFQFAMPLIGWSLGRAVVEFTHQWAPWLAFAVLLFLGLKMIRESLQDEEESDAGTDPTKGMSLVALSVATSIDALGVGFSLGIMNGDIFWAAMVIGLVAGVMTLGAMKLGKRLSARFGKRIGISGGIILLIIAFKLLLG
jgi:putative Mn2+ efflux pump MntP